MALYNFRSIVKQLMHLLQSSPTKIVYHLALQQRQANAKITICTPTSGLGLLSVQLCVQQLNQCNFSASCLFVSLLLHFKIFDLRLNQHIRIFQLALALKLRIMVANYIEIKINTSSLTSLKQNQVALISNSSSQG